MLPADAASATWATSARLRRSVVGWFSKCCVSQMTSTVDVRHSQLSRVELSDHSDHGTDHIVIVSY